MPGEDLSGQNLENSSIIADLKKQNLLMKLIDYALKDLQGDLSKYSVTARKGRDYNLFGNLTLFLVSGESLYACTHDGNTGEITSDMRIFDPYDPFYRSIKQDAVPLQLIYKDEVTKGLEGLDEDENQETN
jgi:hypothetical protein